MVTGSKIVDLGVTRVWWVSTIAALPALTVIEIAAGKDISKSLLPDYKFGAQGSTVVSERDITALFDSETPTIGKYDGSLHLFRKLLPTGIAGSDDYLSTFSGHPHGFLVRRVGPPSEQVLAIGDVVDVGEFIADAPQMEAGTGSGFLKITVPLLSQGFYYPSIVTT